MLENLELIEAYCSGRLSATEKLTLEIKIKTDTDFAKEFNFYLQSKAVAKQLANEERKAEWEAIRKDANQPKQGFIRLLRPFATSVAACLVLIFAWNTWFSQPTFSTNELAIAYIDKNLSVLNVPMSSTQDSLELGAMLYNQKKYAEAVKVFEAIRVRKVQEEAQALTYTGLGYLQLKQYNKALETFKRLANNKEIVVNKGKFYQALTLMRRNASQDKTQAIILLNEVVKSNLGGKKEATEWLKKLR